MPFVLTEKDDTAKVLFKTENGDFTIIVGAIPAAIGEKIESCQGETMGLYRGALAGAENIDALTIKAKHSAREASELLCKYGIRGHEGLNNSSGVAIPCVTVKEEGSGYTILDDATLNLYMGNESFLEDVMEKLVILRRVGIARYVLEGEAALENAKAMGESNAAPFMNELETSLETSTNSAKPSAQA